MDEIAFDAFYGTWVRTTAYRLALSRWRRRRMDIRALVNRGGLAPVGGCTVDNPIPTLAGEGIAISSGADTVDFIDIHSSRHATQSGIAVGMTMGKAKQLSVPVEICGLQITGLDEQARWSCVPSGGRGAQGRSPTPRQAPRSGPEGAR